MYYKRLIVDIDDTISYTTNRDWENAKPNVSLIHKLNKLYDEGWEVHYYTARGSISCKNREEAENVYKPIILKWFFKHNVKFTELSFNKPLGTYYIDDKAITPEDFLDLDIEVLNGGLSGAIIERRGNKVYKTHDNSLKSASWYEQAANIIKSIKVHSVIGKTICMDYIEKTDEPTLEQINFIIDKFKEVPSAINFSTYAERINDHMNLYKPTYQKAVNKLMQNNGSFYNFNKSFCHGDMSLDNMINSNGTLYLIDPIYEPGLYSSWLLDVAKILHSSRRFNKPHIYDYFINKYKNISNELKILELTHWIRMRKYQELEKIDELDNIINTLMKEI